MDKTRFRKKLILVSCQCFFALVICEFALRLFKPARLVGISHMPCIYVRDERNGFGYMPNATGWLHRYFEMDNAVIINSKGFHDVEHDGLDPNDLLRIVAIGDSFTAALEVAVSSTWTQVLQKQLNHTRGSSAQVINLGLDGTGTDVHKNVLESYLQSGSADVVVLAFYANDVDDMRQKRLFREVYHDYVIPYQSELQKRGIIEHIVNHSLSRPARWLHKNSYVCRAIMSRSNKYRLMRKNLVSPHRSGIKISEYTDEAWSGRVEETFCELTTLSHEHGFKLLVVPVPTKDDPSESMTRLLNYLTPKVRDELVIVDILPTMNELLKDEGLGYHQLFWKYDNHFNAAGNRLYGTALARMMDEYKL